MPAIPTVLGRQPTAPRARRLQGAAHHFQREGVAGQDGVHGRKRVPVIPTVEANISDDGTLSLQQLVAMLDETVTVEPDNGKTYIYQQAWYFDLAQLDTGEGQIGVKFEALTAYEEVAGALHSGEPWLATNRADDGAASRGAWTREARG
jgi:hypothetical protein